MLTIGLDGASRISPRLCNRSEGGIPSGLAIFNPDERDADHVVLLAAAHEVVLEGDPAAGRLDSRPDRVVGHRDDRRLDPEAPAKLIGDF